MKHWKAFMVAGAAISAVAGVGYSASEYKSQIEGEYAKRIDLAATQVQVRSLYDARIEQLIIQRDRLLRKGRLSEQEKRDLQDIERQIELNKKLRDSK